MKLHYELEVDDAGSYWFFVQDEDTISRAEGVIRADGFSKLTFVHQDTPIASLGQALLDVHQAVRKEAVQ